MGEFNSVSILLPTLNETFSFIETVKIILEECDKKDLHEFIAIVCERTEKESLKSIEEAKLMSEKEGVPLHILYQTKPFAGGAVQDGMDLATGSHTIMMAPDLETDPHSVKEFIEMAKKYPDDMITASRWKKKGNFAGYNKVKFVLNFLFQKIFSLFYGVKLTDITFGYRLAPTKLFQSIAWEELRHPFFLETALKPICLGVKIHEISSGWAARQEGESQNSLLQTFKYLKIAFKVKFEKKKNLLKETVKDDSKSDKEV
ncbi:MAG: glycosyltransferase family 2 protein [Lachnospiraceae bacterium]|jgi:hypothetical protein|nr:MAG: glycosyltransferase family 2 protein [Lachnospiraceae bacterium]